MPKSFLKYISLFLVVIILFYSFSPLVFSSFLKNEVQASSNSSNIEPKEVLRGFGLAVLLYIFSKIGQALFSSGRPVPDSESDIELLARVIYAEARGEPLRGQIAVGAVVLNRLDSSDFPDNVRDVIFEKRQFSSVYDGQIRKDPNQNAFNAAEKALAGEDPSEGALYFYNPEKSEPRNLRWLKKNTIFIKRIGDHVFSR